ncbi:MAG: hypothetical protein E7H83_26260 [Enterobacteriaceae bacterium]|jgi:hypothetical protein|nr:hypothetical protein [Enterobacteriaceae bacterium]PTA96336.1 hypothetical protein C9415_05745 [Kluyvera sp. Nf5]
MSDSSNVLCLKTEPKPYGVEVEWTWPDGSHWFSRVELQYVREKSIPVVKVIEWPVTGLFISGLKVGEKIHVRMRGLDKEGNGPWWKASDWIEGVASELQSTNDEVLDSIRKSDVFKILNGQTFINDTLIKGADVNSATIKGTLHINPALTKVSLTDSMRDAVIAAVRESGQFVEKPTGDEQQSVVFRADRFKVTVEVSASGGSTTQEQHEQIQQAANAVIEATNAALARQDAAMADLASAQAAITESINQAVSDAIANALKPGGLLYARK